MTATPLLHGSTPGTLLNEQGRIVAKVEGADAAEKDDRAAFIVQSCNAHAELVAALEGLVNDYDLQRTGADAGMAAYDKARAALAKVRP